MNLRVHEMAARVEGNKISSPWNISSASLAAVVIPREHGDFAAVLMRTIDWRDEQKHGLIFSIYRSLTVTDRRNNKGLTSVCHDHPL